MANIRWQTSERERGTKGKKDQLLLSLVAGPYLSASARRVVATAVLALGTSRRVSRPRCPLTGLVVPGFTRGHRLRNRFPTAVICVPFLHPTDSI
jgi:hypothetical protein